MSNFLVSSYSFASTARSAVSRAQNDLRIAQKEVVSGSLDDVGLSLGSGTARSISLRAEMENTDRLRDANSGISQRFDIMQSALEAVSGGVEATRSATIAGGANPVAAGTLVTQASASLDGLATALNSSSGSRFLFSGAHTDRPGLSFTAPDGTALSSYEGSTAQAATQAALKTFLTENSIPDVASMTADDVKAFLAPGGAFDALFAYSNPPTDPASGWSRFSGTVTDPVYNRIDGKEQLNTAYTASDASFRDIAKAYVMLGDLGLDQMNEDARQVLTSRATETLDQGLDQLTTMRGDIGSGQKRLESKDEILKSRSNILSLSITSREKVDPYEASVRVTNLTNLLETSYALTSRLSRLSLLNYL